MVMRKFQTRRPQAIAARAERIRRMHQLRQMLADMDSPFGAFTEDLYPDESNSYPFLGAALH